jgi:sporulation protein YlmC with PRC-barrel domain
MLRTLLVGALALVVAAGPGFAQERQPPAAQMESLVGLAVYSSDGQRLGEIREVGMSGTQPAVRADIGGFLDVAQSAVVIPINMIVQKPDRIELSMTAAEVKDTLNKQKP